MSAVGVILSIIQYAAPWALVVMGAVVSVRGPDRENKRAVLMWIIAFALVGAVVTGAQVWSDIRDREEQEAAFKKLRKELTGEENYAYFEIRPPIKECDKLYMRLVQKGFVRDVAVGWHQKNKTDQYTDMNTWGGKLHTFIGDTIQQSQPIRPGNYKIAFRSPNNNWYQYFDLDCSGDTLQERIDVVRKEESIFQQARTYQIVRN